MRPVHTHSKPSRSSRKRGFSLIEILMVVAAMSTIGAIGIVQLGNTTTAVKSTKLQQDVAAVNRAVKTYVMSGGDLMTVQTGEQVIERLKSVASASQRSKIAGLRGAMLDHRIKPIPTNSGDRPRAVWNDSKKTFFIENTGAGFSEFVLDDTITAPAQQDNRSMAMALDTKDKWIWKFNEAGAPVHRPGMATSPVTTHTSPVAPVDPILLQLAAPAFSLTGGNHPLRNFDLNVSLSNPNSNGSSDILYSIGRGPFQRYTGPLIVTPNTVITAYSDSLNPDMWSDSGPLANTYTFQPVALQLNFAVPKTAVTYQEVGGRMIPGTTALPDLLTGGRASLLNASDLPAKHSNDSVFNIRWTYDGSDPLRSADAATGSPFTGGFPGQNVATALDLWGTNPSLPIRVAAKAINTTLVSSSPIVGVTLTALPVTLRPPLITLDPATGQAFIALDTRFSDMPEGARIGYTTDGKDPADKLTPSGKGLYTGPFTSPGGTRIMARVYPPEGREAWFITSSSASVLTPPIEKLQLPLIALSNPKFDQNVGSISVTLTNPNPTGSSQLYYAIKQPTDAFPPLTAFLPYTGPLTTTSSIYPNGFQVQAYVKTLLPLNWSDSDAAEAATTADFFDVALEGDVLLVIDASGSMSARFGNTSRFKRVITETVNAINSLKSTQRFNVITFNKSVHWSDGTMEMKLATNANKNAAVSALLRLKNWGGTNYEAGLKHALALTNRPTQVVFLSDGKPNHLNYLDEVAALANLNIKIDTIGIGHTESQIPLREMAGIGKGAYRFVMEPTQKGALSPPRLSIKGGTFTYTQFPLQLVLTNPNTVTGSYISYSLNGGPQTVYNGAIPVPYDGTIEASVESADESWGPSDMVIQSYLAQTFTAAAPVIRLSSNTFTDSNPGITMTLENKSPASLTSVVWWFETESESKARKYEGPVSLVSKDWNLYASATLKDVTILARAVPEYGFVYKGAAATTDIYNQCTAFLTNLGKPALARSQFGITGGVYSHDKFPMVLTLANPNGVVGDLMFSTNEGSSYELYSGPINVQYNSVIHSYVAPKVSDTTWRSSPVTSQTYTPAPIQLAAPIIGTTATEFNTQVKTITVTLTNPNSASLSQLVYWFEGQDPSVKAVTYTGPFNLEEAEWETYIINGRTDAKLIVQAVGRYSFCKSSSLVQLVLQNTN